MSSPPAAEGLFNGLEGADSWDNPAAWDVLLMLEAPEDEPSEAPAAAGEIPPVAGGSEAREALQEAGYAAGRLCPLERCPWARQGICVLRFGDWCPNRKGRKAAENRKKEGRPCRK